MIPTRAAAGRSCLLLLLMVLPGHPVRAQASPLVVELRSGAALPVASFAGGSQRGEGTSAGLSFGVDFALPGGGRWTPYVGFAQHRFPCAGAGCVADGRYVATGFHAGYRIVPFPSGALVPWLRIGALSTRVETDALGGADAGVSELGFGAELGAGFYVGGFGPLGLSPGVRMAAVNTDLPGGSVLRLRYLVADIALVLGF